MIQDGVVILPILVKPLTNQRGYHLTALDATTGKLLWQWKTQEEIETTTLGDTVYASIYSSRDNQSQSGWVKAIDLKTGRERWTHSMLGGYLAMANDREVFVWDRSEKSSTRYVVLDRQTGAVLRQFTLAPDENPGGGGQLAGNTIYKVSLQSTGSWGTAENHSWIEAFDARNGKQLWRTPTLRNSHINRFTIAGDRLILVGTSSIAAKSVVQSYQIESVK